MNSIEHLTNSSAPDIDPFRSDYHRAKLASEKSLALLSESYLPGVLPELPDLSSQALWAEMANYETIPDFRLRRLRQVVSRLSKKRKILDVGSGWGEIIPIIRKESEREYVAMDFSQKMIE
jgi:hypothetical protein